MGTPSVICATQPPTDRIFLRTDRTFLSTQRILAGLIEQRENAIEQIIDAAWRDVADSDDPFATLKFQSLLFTEDVFRAADRGESKASELLKEELPRQLQLIANLRNAENQIRRRPVPTPRKFLEATLDALELLAAEHDLPIASQFVSECRVLGPSTFRLEVIDTRGSGVKTCRRVRIDAALAAETEPDGFDFRWQFAVS